MNTILRNILAVVLGLVLGGAVNGGLIALGPHIIPPPAGADVSTMKGLTAAMPLMEPRHFLFPFVAHALGVLAGALFAFLIAGSHREIFAYVIGGVTLIGGIAASYLLPAPVWFIVVDLVFAYLPMSWLAIQVGRRLMGRPADATS